MTEVYSTIANGHVIYFDGDCWRYADNEEKYHSDEISPRGCPNCGEQPVWCELCCEYHDACLGHIPGASDACCGHGYRDQAYVWYENPRELGEETERLLNK